jgi:nitrogen PTS system EIIA component
MKISEFLSPASTIVDVRATDKGQLLRDLSERASAVLHLPAELIASELTKREGLGSTGLGGGIAIPHARLTALTKPHGILARLKQPIDFDAIDGQRVDLVFVLLLPKTEPGAQLTALACVTRQLRNASVLSGIRSGAGPAEVYDAVSS